MTREAPDKKGAPTVRERSSPRARPAQSAFWKVMDTDLGWFGFRRCLAWAEQVIDRSGLPEAHRVLIARVVRRTRLWRREQADVARELVAHFADGLEAGRTEADLLSSFGNEKKAARLIRRAKKRNRGPVWRAWLYWWRAVGCLFLLVLAVYLYYGVQVWTARPKIARNYLAELNAPAEAVPPEDRGWPLMREAILAYDRSADVIPEEGDEPSRKAFLLWSERPGTAYWPLAAERLRENEHVLDLVRAAAAKPRLAFRPGVDDDAALQMKWNWIASEAEFTPPNPTRDLMNVLQPHLAEIKLFARMLTAEMHLAASEDRGARVPENTSACVRLAEQAREIPFVINDLVAISISHLTCDTIRELLERRPDALRDRQWRDVGHALASFSGGGRIVVNLAGERAIFRDFLQRSFSDDGKGGGLAVPRAMPSAIMGEIFLPEDDDLREGRDWLLQLAAPVAALVMANRRSQSAYYDRLMNQAESWFSRPQWEQPRQADVREAFADVETRSIRAFRYWPVRMALPALMRAQATAEQTTQVRDATLVAIALELFRRREGRYPESLDELVPAFLPAVPPDRHTGKPLNYAVREGKPILYSVGVNLADDGGAPARRPPTGITGRLRVEQWRHPLDLKQMREESPRSIPDGDWILYPPSLARETEDEE